MTEVFAKRTPHVRFPVRKALALQSVSMLPEPNAFKSMCLGNDTAPADLDSRLHQSESVFDFRERSKKHEVIGLDR